jgi:hypothetical protein
MRAILATIIAVAILVLACDAYPQDKTVEKEDKVAAPQVRPVTPVKPVEKKYVNSKQITLSYDLKGFGRSGVSSIELWYCDYNPSKLPPAILVPPVPDSPRGLPPIRSEPAKLAGPPWNKLTDYPLDLKIPGPKKLAFEVMDEGLYGITLVTKNGVGIGGNPPAAGDRPQTFVFVDLTPPVVAINKVTVGTWPDQGKLTVEWTATDANMAPHPVRFSYAEKKEGKWITFADKIENTGKYAWQMLEDNLPPQFYLKVEAIDLAGNIGQAITTDTIKADLSVPTATILDVQPSGR